MAQPPTLRDKFHCSTSSNPYGAGPVNPVPVTYLRDVGSGGGPFRVHRHHFFFSTTLTPPWKYLIIGARKIKLLRQYVHTLLCLIPGNSSAAIWNKKSALLQRHSSALPFAGTNDFTKGFDTIYSRGTTQTEITSPN